MEQSKSHTKVRHDTIHSHKTETNTVIKKIITGLILSIFISIILIAQNTGTPDTLRILIDATGALVTTFSAQTLPLSSPTVFSNTRLKTDASGNLVITDGSGAGFAPANATYITQTPNAALSAEQALSSLSTGLMNVTTTTGVVTSIANVAANQVLTSGTPPAWSSSPTVTSITESQTALGTTSTDGNILINSTAATGGTTVQISPRTKHCGTAWNSSSSASQVDCWIIENLPVTVAGTTTQTLRIGSSINGGAYTYPFTMASSGTLTYLDFSASSSGFNIGTNGVFRSSAFGTAITMPTADGLINFRNNADSAGVGFDFATDGLLKVKNRAQSAGGIVSAQFTTVTNATSVANVGANSCGTTAATLAGTNNTGIVTVGATSGTQCRILFSRAATTRRQCTVTNETTANLSRTAYIDTTHSDLLGVFVAGDILAYVCLDY